MLSGVFVKASLASVKCGRLPARPKEMPDDFRVSTPTRLVRLLIQSPLSLAVDSKKFSDAGNVML